MTAWPFVKSARLLSSRRRRDRDVAAPTLMHGHCEATLNSVAATIIDGETASRLRQERLAGSRSREERSQRPVAGPRSSSGRFWRVPGSAAEAGRGGGSVEE